MGLKITWGQNNVRYVDLTLDISMQSIKNRELWTVFSDKLAVLSFCVRTELVPKEVGTNLTDTSVSLAENNFLITLNLSTNSTVSNQVV